MVHLLLRPEQLERAKELLAKFRELERRLAEKRREYRQYSLRERVDWKDNNNRVAQSIC